MEKRVVSISLGDSERDFAAKLNILGTNVRLERIGTDGDLDRYIRLLEEYDEQVDAIGFGGFDLYLWCNGKRYIWREPEKLLCHVRQTPVCDGSGLKNSLERKTIDFLQEENLVDFSRSKTLIVCAVDRFGMAEAIWVKQGQVIFGDLMFGLHVPIPLKSMFGLKVVARLLLPLVVRRPIKSLYPTGEKQRVIEPKFGQYYHWADIIAGDNHLIRHYLPDNLDSKVIITNTTTQSDIDLYRQRGVTLVVTTTPSLNGRSPGTNVFEAAIVAVLEKDPSLVTSAEYLTVLEGMNWRPNLLHLQKT